MTPAPSRCTANNANGMRCVRDAVAPHFEFCARHEPGRPAPTTAQKPQNVAQRGALRTLDDVFAMLERAARLARHGDDRSLAQAKVLISAANSARAVIERSLEAEVAELRALVEQQLGAE